MCVVVGGGRVPRPFHIGTLGGDDPWTYKSVEVMAIIKLIYKNKFSNVLKRFLVFSYESKNDLKLPSAPTCLSIYHKNRT